MEEIETVEDALLRDLDDLENISEDEKDVEENIFVGPEVPDSKEAIKSEVILQTGVSDITMIAKLKRNPAYISHIEKIKSNLEKNISQIKKGDEEYKLIVKSNYLVSEITDEITIIHKFVQERYSKRFHGLETIVVNPVDYFRIIVRIGNDLNIPKIKLEDILPPNQVMVVTVTAGTEKSPPLPEKDMNIILDATNEGLSLHEDRQLLLDYVASRMSLLAPNLSELTGNIVAAKLIGKAGGIEELSKIPSCNIYLLGQTRVYTSGFSASSDLVHKGFIYETDLVQNAPVDLKSKVCKVLANKIALAARYDFNGYNTNNYGLELKNIILAKIDKWQKPQQTKVVKPLVILPDKPMKRRGGKRVRKRKETFAMTEIRKKQNRLLFGTSSGEYGDTSMGIDFGMLGQENTGQIRATKQEKKGLKKKLSFSSNSGGGGTSGFSSSYAFTPLQGVELVNPDYQKEKLKVKSDPYFSKSGGFTSVVPK